MNAGIDARRLGAFLDGELGLEEQLAMESRLEQDDELRAQLQALQALRETLKQRAEYHEMPASLRRWVQERAAPEAARRPFAGGAARWRSWLATPWMAAAGGAAAVLLGVGLLMPPAADPDALLQQEAVAGHVRASLSQRRVDVQSSEQHTVKPWLSARLDYSPPVPEMHRPGLVFEGARLDYLDGRNVAVLVYRQGQHQVDEYVWPAADHAHDSSPRQGLVRGFRVAGWTGQGLRHCVVSDVNEAEFAALVAALRQAGGGPEGKEAS